MAGRGTSWGFPRKDFRISHAAPAKIQDRRLLRIGQPLRVSLTHAIGRGRLYAAIVPARVNRVLLWCPGPGRVNSDYIIHIFSFFFAGRPAGSIFGFFIKFCKLFDRRLNRRRLISGQGGRTIPGWHARCHTARPIARTFRQTFNILFCHFVHATPPAGSMPTRKTLQ